MRPEKASGSPVGGEDYPRNAVEFQRWFRSEADCAEFLEQLRWPNGFLCPKCGHDHYWPTSEGLFLCCKCRRKTSVRAGTLFDKSQLSLLRWFQAIWYVVEQTGGVSALGLQRALGFGSYETAWAWLQKLRRAMEPTSGLLKSQVEVDEAYFGGLEPGVTGRETKKKSLVVVAAEIRGDASDHWSAGRTRMRRIASSGSEDLIGFITDTVAPITRVAKGKEAKTKVITDGWPRYEPLPDYGYEHIAHNVSKSDKTADQLLPAVHRVISLSKRWLLGTHQGSVAPSHLDFYLAEWCFRFNRRRARHRGLLFYDLVKQAAHTNPHPYSELLSPLKGELHRKRRKKWQAKRAKGVVKVPRNLPRDKPIRPGGSRTRLDDDLKKRRRRTVGGRRGGKTSAATAKSADPSRKRD